MVTRAEDRWTSNDSGVILGSQQNIEQETLDVSHVADRRKADAHRCADATEM